MFYYLLLTNFFAIKLAKNWRSFLPKNTVTEIITKIILHRAFIISVKKQLLLKDLLVAYIIVLECDVGYEKLNSIPVSQSFVYFYKFIVNLLRFRRRHNNPGFLYRVTLIGHIKHSFWRLNIPYIPHAIFKSCVKCS